MGGIFCILQLHVNLKIHLCIFNHNINIKAISLKDIISLWLQCSLWLLLILWDVLILWCALILYGVERFIFLSLSLKSFLCFFGVGFKFGIAFWCVDEQDFAACILILINFTSNSRITFNGLRYLVMLLSNV